MSADAPRAQTISPHKRALVLTALLFIVFVVTTGLYARFGYGFVLRVYEAQQLSFAIKPDGKARLHAYKEYLGVDPVNLYVRGLFINQLIRVNSSEVLLVAEEGVAAVLPDQQPMALLLLARAQIARGQLPNAELTYRRVLAAVGESGEAHYGLARIAAAWGDFEKMQTEYQNYRWSITTTNSPDFAREIGDGDSNRVPGLLGSFVTVATGPYLSIHYEKYGEIDRAFGWLRDLDDHKHDPTYAFAFFLRGVYEEKQGNREAALESYQRAAGLGDALGKFAVARLNPPSTDSEQ